MIDIFGECTARGEDGSSVTSLDEYKLLRLVETDLEAAVIKLGELIDEWARNCTPEEKEELSTNLDRVLADREVERQLRIQAAPPCPVLQWPVGIGPS